MTADQWHKQGELIGSTFTEKDWAMTQGATSNPGTVQAHIDRALAQAKKQDWHNNPCHNVEPVNVKENCKPCNFVPELKYCPNETKAIEAIALRTYLTTLAF